MGVGFEATSGVSGTSEVAAGSADSFTSTCSVGAASSVPGTGPPSGVASLIVCNAEMAWFPKRCERKPGKQPKPNDTDASPQQSDSAQYFCSDWSVPAQASRRKSYEN